MKVGKAKLFGKARKDIDGDSGTFHRGNGGSRARKVARCKRAIEKRCRQSSKKEIRRGDY